MNIILRELKLHFKSIIIWSISMFIFVYMAMMKFDATSTAAGSLAAIVDNMPKAIQVMIGGGHFDLSSPIGFFAATFLYIALLGAVHGSMTGASILSKEERDKTAEFILVKPITRSRLVFLKMVASFIIVTILSIVVFIASQLVVGTALNSTMEYFGDVTKLSLGYYLIEIIFLFLGIFISTTMKRVKLATPITSLVLFITFFFSIFAQLFTQVEFLKYLSPFSWFDPTYLLGVFDFEIPFIIVYIVVLIISIALSFKFYNKREMEI